MNRYSMIVQGSDEDQLFFVTPTGARLKQLFASKTTITSRHRQTSIQLRNHIHQNIKTFFT